jgi:hypothetical protein
LTKQFESNSVRVRYEFGQREQHSHIICNGGKGGVLGKRNKNDMEMELKERAFQRLDVI